MVEDGQLEVLVTIQVVIAGLVVAQDIIQVEMLSMEVLDITQVGIISIVEMRALTQVTLLSSQFTTKHRYTLLLPFIRCRKIQALVVEAAWAVEIT
jgi:hypothetical protein